jgi:ubiquinone/menaquinone biosynthesis C-methylase UbiE
VAEVHSSNFSLGPGGRNLLGMRTAAEFWAIGEYDRVAELILELGRVVVSASGVRAGQRVLDVGAGTGNATLPAAATGAEVIATDITPELLAVGQRAAQARGLDVTWQVADAQDLPFPDDSFDVVLSTVGAMFAPDHKATARELLRVCRPGGTVAMANWTPDGAAGRLFQVLGRYLPEPGPDAGPPPTAWGVPEHVAELFGDVDVHTERRTMDLGYTGPPDQLAAYYREHFAPVIATRADLDPARAEQLDRDLLRFFTEEDAGVPGGPSHYRYEYLLVLARP